MDSNDESNMLVCSTSKVSNAQSIYYPIFQPSIDTFAQYATKDIFLQK